MKKLLPFIILLFVFTTFGQEKYRANVYLNVQYSEDKSIQSELYSFLSRELRSLNDVELVADSKTPGTFKMSVVGVAVKSGEIVKGYALSATISQQMRCQTKFKNQDGSIMVTEYDDLKDHQVIITPTEDLRKIAQSFIADFDVSILEFERKIFKIIHPSVKQ